MHKYTGFRRKYYLNIYLNKEKRQLKGYTYFSYLMTLNLHSSKPNKLNRNNHFYTDTIDVKFEGYSY